MERFWNLIHYFVYRAIFKIGKLITDTSPIRLFVRILTMRRTVERKGRTVEEIEDDFTKLQERPDYGLSIVYSGGFMGFLVVAVLDAVINLVPALRRLRPASGELYAIVLVLIVLAIDYPVLWRHDKYIKYFREFDKMSGGKRWLWALVTLIVVVGLLALSVGSWAYRPHANA